jgi:short-subunit dehydrogenase
MLQLDVLVNNAGRSQRANWEDIDLDVDKEMFDLNVFSVLSLSRIAVQYFTKKNEGHIVVTSSVTGLAPIPYSASYTGAKHAIHVSPTLKRTLRSFEVLVVVSMKSTIFWEVVLCSPIKVHQCFGGTYCVHFQYVHGITS